MFRNPLRNLKIPPFTRIGKLETWVQIQGILLKKSLISKILLRSMLAARHFFLNYFTENGPNRALFGSPSTRKHLQNQPACHSHLTELLHVDIR